MDASVRGSNNLGNLLTKMTVVPNSSSAAGSRPSSAIKRPRTGVSAYDKKAMLDNWIGEELSKFEIKQEEKATLMQKEIETASGPTRYSQVITAADNIVTDAVGNERSTISQVRGSTASYGNRKKQK